MIIVSQLMLQTMCALPERQGRKLSPKLRKMLAAGIIEENGCWIPGARRGSATKSKIQYYLDCTGCEMSINDFYLGDYVSKKKRHDFVTLQEQGFLLVKALIGLLEPLGVFRILLYFSPCLDPGNPVMTGKVRFHKIRPEDVPWGDDDVDKYPGEEAILVFITDKKPNPGIVAESTWPEFVFRPAAVTEKK